MEYKLNNDYFELLQKYITDTNLADEIQNNLIL